MGLFGPIELETTNTKTRLPMPIPEKERDTERDRLVEIGIGFSVAQQLAKADWTLEQLQCRWQLDDWSDHPKFVQDVKALVTAHCEQSWPKQKPKDKEVSHVGVVTEGESRVADSREHHRQSA